MSNVIRLADYRRQHRPPGWSDAPKTALMFAATSKLYREATGLAMVDDDGGMTEEFLCWVSTQPRPNPREVLTSEEVAILTR